MGERTPSERAGELAALRDLFAYNVFVRKRYLDAIVKLPKRTVTRDRGASFPSILDIHTHVLAACKSWLHAYETGEVLPVIKGLSVSEVRSLEAEVDGYLDGFIRRLKPGDLERSFRYTLGTGRKKKVITRNVADMLWHMVEEELQHRGELNALLWQDDIEPPVTDWFEWKKESGKRRTGR